MLPHCAFDAESADACLPKQQAQANTTADMSHTYTDLLAPTSVLSLGAA
jgi:hypothetical protein